MAKLGTVPAARRYDGIASGPQFAYIFETQEGIPVDGTSALLRDLSPFTLRFVVPDALIEMASSTEEEAVDLLQAAALGASTAHSASEVAHALGTITVVGSSTNTQISVEQFVALGQHFSGASSAFTSTIADAFQAADVTLQLQRILAAEPLTLLVNPTEMSIQYTKVQSYQSRTRFGYVFEAWGEEQPTISISGTTAGFVAGAVDVSNPFGAQVTGTTSSVSGYQAASRRDSAAWQNFMSLYQFYRSNGYIYDTINKSEAHLFIGAVAIDYDQKTYVGTIESFSYRIEDASPHKVTFNIEFKVSRRYDLASASSVGPQSSSTTSPTRTALFGGPGVPIGGRMTTSAPTVTPTEIAQTPIDILGGS